MRRENEQAKKAERILRTGYGGSDCTIVRKHRGTGQSETGNIDRLLKEKQRNIFIHTGSDLQQPV
mgnify:CR=1 FL=1